jgi:hypothetical protein
MNESGFEIKLPGDDEATFFPWSMSPGGGKELIFIDRIADMPFPDFYESIQDEHEQKRGPMAQTLLAIAVSQKFPEWTAERTIRLVVNLNLFEDVTYINADEEEEKAGPPPESGEANNTGASAASPNESKSSATRPATSSPATSKPTPA